MNTEGAGRTGSAQIWICALVLALVAGACTSGGGADAPSTTAPEIDIQENSSESDGATAALGFDLREGSPTAPAGPSTDVVDGQPLEDDDATAVLDRLPEWDIPEGDRTDFERPAETSPPPQPGETIDTEFPPSDPGPDRPAEPDGPLQVVRFQPEGDVDVAPFFTVTFNQPMVPLATLEELEAADVPVDVTPAVEGRWRWLGTRALRFEVVPGDTDRLPAATEYTVEVPAGTTSANGAVLAEAVSWSFSTPAPSVTRFVGESDSLGTEPVFVAVFDQLVDPDAVLGSITLEAGDAAVELRSATESEIEGHAPARRAVKRALDGRWVAFTPTDPLPVDTALDISIGPGVPSAEGPRTSETAHSYRARTFGAFEVTRSRCDYGGGACRPTSPFIIELSNPIDRDSFSADLVTVDPAIPGLSVNTYGQVIELFGGTAGNTDYTVTLDGSLTDVFGQTLGGDVDETFEVGDAEPRLDGLSRKWITVDPMADTPSVPIFTVNHDSVHVTAWAVAPDQLDEFNGFHNAHYHDTDPPEPDWPVVLDTEVEIDGEQDRAVETAIDLSGAFAEAGSQIVVRVEPTREISESQYWQNRATVAWVQDTTLGIDAYSDRGRLVIWTTDLTTGEPVGNVPVELIGDGRVVTTDEQGLAQVELDDQGVRGLHAEDGDRSAFLNAGRRGGWKSKPRADGSRWYVFDDRGIYQPGETVRLAGWVRRLVRTDGHQLELYDDDATLTYTAHDRRGNEIISGDVEVNALGGFNLTFDVPDGANLGRARIKLELDAGEDRARTGHRFEIQEFRRPEFEVTARAETPPPYVAAEPATVAVDAAYYAGGPLGDARVDWLVSTSETSYSPPKWGDYSFGVWTPWWQSDIDEGYDDHYDYDIGPVQDVEYKEFTGRTDAAGTHLLEIGFRDGEGDDDVDLPSSVTAEATVSDVNRQPISSRTELLVHAAEHYVGIRSDRPFVEQGTPMRIESVVTDIDGELVAGREAEITAGRVEWVYEGGHWTEELVDPQHCNLTSSAATEPDARASDMTCEFATEVGGQYRITAVVTDEGGNRNRSELTVWVSGGQGRPSLDVERQDVTIVPDSETYAPGDTAELLVQAPFAPAFGSITTMQGGIETTETFTAEDGSAIVEVPITDANVPNLTLHVAMNGTAERTADDGTPVPDAPPRPAYATGQVTLSVPPVTRALDVTVEPGAAELEPGDDTDVTVEVLSPDGEPVDGADVAVVVVDEAVLALTDYKLADPLDIFYAPFRDRLNARYARAAIQLTRTDLLSVDDADRASRQSGEVVELDAGAGDEEASAASEDAAAPAEQAAGQIDVREDFDALAVFAPNESTGPDGRVTVDVPLPDSLTRYRVMAVAVDGASMFGTDESAITARLPLMVRPSAPRFLNFGDTFELPVVVQNQTDREMNVDVAVETSNLELTGPQGKRVRVPADNRVEVRFPVRTDEAGTARFRVAAASTDTSLGHVDAAAGDLPVYTPATAEAFATYGTLDGTGSGSSGSGEAVTVGQPLSAPTGVFPQFGGLEINTSATALQALTDAVIYLVDYRYESADGYASRIMAIAALRDVLEAFDADGLPEPGELDDQVARDIEGLTALQNDDGGFPYWQRGRESVPWVSIQATHALVLADQAGYDVPDRRLERALEHLASIEQHIPDRYPLRLRNTLVAYAIYVRGLSGDVDTAAAEALYLDAGDDLELDAVAWLWPSVADPDLRAEIELRFTNAAVETAGAATFTTGYGEDAYLIAHSSRRTDGIILDALISQTPDSDLIPKVVSGLMGGQTKGRWNNAHENAFILVALHEYFATFESVTPDFVARTWLGDEYVFEHGFEGRTTERANTLVPMSELVAAGDTDLLVQNDGVGRLYYRLGLRYAPDDLVLDPRDEGFVVERTYEAVDDPADVTRDANGTWHIKAGAAVRVRLTMVADARRTHVALVDPLPAGLEPVNPALAVSQTFAPDEDRKGDGGASWQGWWWNWFDHQNLRDDRVEAFSAYLPGGTYDYSYVARATTPGTFVTPPTKAEEIYAPETFGRSASDSVIVE